MKDILNKLNIRLQLLQSQYNSIVIYNNNGLVVYGALMESVKLKARIDELGLVIKTIKKECVDESRN